MVYSGCVARSGKRGKRTLTTPLVKESVAETPFTQAGMRRCNWQKFSIRQKALLDTGIGGYPRSMNWKGFDGAVRARRKDFILLERSECLDVVMATISVQQ
jgi:hypothetical protein